MKTCFKLSLLLILISCGVAFAGGPPITPTVGAITGLGTIATVNSPVPVANGGTGSTSAAGALTALGGATAEPSLVVGYVSQIFSDTASGVATLSFSISTTNEAGSGDGGSYSVEVEGFAGSGVSSVSGISAIMPFKSSWSRCMMSTGATGVTTAVTTTKGVAGTTNAANRNVRDIVVATSEVSEYQDNILVTLSFAGSSVPLPILAAKVTIRHRGFVTAPTIAIRSL